MRIKNLHWNVLIEDFNKREIVFYDIFKHGGFSEDLKAANRKFKNDKDFLKEVEALLQYYFWSKCEYEVIVGSLFANGNSAKINAFDQIEMNWDRFADYLLENRKK